MKLILIAIFVFYTTLAAIAQNQPSNLSADDIIRRMEANQTHRTAIIEGRMIIHDRFGQRSSSFTSYSQGSEYFLLEFTSRNEEGQRVLRRDGSLYLYYPDARELIRIQGAALRDSLLGSDVSYEDMTGGRGLAADYSFSLDGSEEIMGRPHFRLQLSARGTNVAYPEQTYWIDSEHFVLSKSQQFARNGRLLKTTEILETRQQDDYHFPSHIRITDETRRSSGTEMIFDNARLDAELPPDIFSLETLSW